MTQPVGATGRPTTTSTRPRRGSRSRSSRTCLRSRPPSCGSTPAAGSPKTAVRDRAGHGHENGVGLGSAVRRVRRMSSHRCTARRQPRASGSFAVPESRASGLPGLAESTQRLSPDLKAANPETPWADIAGLRRIPRCQPRHRVGHRRTRASGSGTNGSGRAHPPPLPRGAWSPSRGGSRDRVLTQLPRWTTHPGSCTVPWTNALLLISERVGAAGLEPTTCSL